MGIIDRVATLLPRRTEREDAPFQRSGALARRQDFSRRPGLGRRQDVARRQQDLGRRLEQLLADPFSLLANPLALDVVADVPWAPTTDVHETDDAVIVTVEVPGLDRGEIEITVTPGGLAISGEKREQREEQRRDYHISEVQYGSFYRLVPLPPGLDLDRAEARVNNGVLNIRIPKASAERAQGREIPVQTA